MMFSYLAKKLNSLSASWDEKRSLVKSAEDVENRNRFVRGKFIEMVGGLPERTPLQAVTVAVHERKGYRIENVMFQSQPNFWVTGNLYIPTAQKGPFPGIISPCGHYPLARMQPAYQVVYLNLVNNGFVVFAYDPIGQGERRQYWNPLTNTAEIGEDPDNDHSLPGQLLLLIGEFLSRYFIWDGIRAIDYLETRPEVDKQRIGCAGHSGKAQRLCTSAPWING
jgi:cephalosporin-C deacetylase-like acetyl esterase